VIDVAAYLATSAAAAASLAARPGAAAIERAARARFAPIDSGH
jgi:hypothetical protein